MHRWAPLGSIVLALPLGCFEVPDEAGAGTGTTSSAGSTNAGTGSAPSASSITATSVATSSAGSTSVATATATSPTATTNADTDADTGDDTGTDTGTDTDGPAAQCGAMGTPQCDDDVVVGGELCLGAAVEVVAGNSIDNLAVFDFDLDGFDDVLATQAVGNVGLLLRGTNAGLTNFDTLNLSTAHQDISGGDFNGDGVPDIIALDDDNLRLVLRRGDGAGTFNVLPPTGLASRERPQRFGIGDLNGDGRDDVAVLYWTQVVVLLTNAEGQPSSPTAYAFPGTLEGGVAITIADVDGVDGLDIAVSAYDTGTLGILRNTGGGAFTDAQVYDNPPGGSSDGANTVRAGDVNQDGRLDVLANDFDTNAIYVHLGQDPAGLSAGTPVNVWGRGGFQLADLDDDCALDLVAHNGGDNAIEVFPNRNDGTGTFSVPTALPFGGNSAAEIEAGDFNGDGVMDVVVASPTAIYAYHSNP